MLVENKYYSKLQNNQLQRYQAIFDAYYIKKNEDIKEDEYKWQLRRKLISCFEYKEQVDKMYSKGIEGTDFVALPFYDLLCPEYWNDKTGKYDDSESEIFNEFWLRRW